MSSSDSLAQARAPAGATAADEAAAITASYARGHFTTYYVDCAKLPSGGTASMSAAPGSPAANRADLRGAQTGSILTLGDFSVLPHPGYAGRRGKTLNKPLFLHQLKS
ncbi:hypothetical protein LDHU3_28.2300:CDS1 [Leishmania donovani]|uniref:Hypothetical_protein n=2 Tax=Leishmania donovani species complex TaxID=38574 RepID=A0A6L0XMV0_LEIIN|nr:hypothetical protein LdCL_280022600 [Leishmania donovani]CAC9503788.1 hypothetical_protein [Leishmania infantum]TPP54307.1 hypothetical protein CGC21_22330 [Leishmania donovani]CAJ1990319.1 hypothetical protein LDHU3_28.2300:CDS1 [Leishmania donovani]SUZ43339.1 hypothetical_protein [Leishmania infantum]